MDHRELQQAHSDEAYTRVRGHVGSSDPLVHYLVRWRLKEALRRLEESIEGALTPDTAILVLCAGEGLEGSILCDLAFENVTVSDVSQEGVRQALERDHRLAGLRLDAENAELDDNTFELVIVQDGLHHLQSPVRGFTEMLRIGSRASLFLEPHNSVVGRRYGKEWEVHGEAVNFVFRWDCKLVGQVACSYLGRESHRNLSFPFWHHNLALDRFGRKLGGGRRGLLGVRLAKGILNGVARPIGNQFCGLVLKASS